MVAGYSRWIMARMLPIGSAAELTAGHLRLWAGLGAVPKALVGTTRAPPVRGRADGPQLTEDFAAFAGLPGIRIIQSRRGDPEAKGRVERANGHLGTAFLPGCVHASPTDLNIQLAWPTGCPRRTGVSTAPCERVRPTGSTPTPPGCCRSHPSIRPAGGVPVCGIRATIASVWTPNHHSIHPLAIGGRIEVKSAWTRPWCSARA
jgi:hypothetical protein